MTTQARATQLTIPVSVLVERRLATVGRWTRPQWEALAVVSATDAPAAPRARTRVHEDEKSARFLLSGHSVTLYKDGCESYWFNLVSGRPRLFVVCFVDDLDEDDPDAGLVPALVTANQDEANAHMESDDLVFSVPMPDVVREQVERFVVAHYVPVHKTKRKRKNWVEDTEHARRDDGQGRDGSRG